MSSHPTRRPVGCLALFALACYAPPRAVPEDPRLRFRAVVAGAPGGSFLGVWGDPPRERAFVVGGFVGVDPARVPRRAAGRLVEYRDGRMTTRCSTDAALWWVAGVESTRGVEVWAVGDRGRVVRYRDERCEEIDIGPALPKGEPTLWGVLARTPNDIWAVGGSPRPDGPRGVLLHGDGVSWRREAVPASAADENLYKIAADGDAMVIVGSGGVILRRGAGESVWQVLSSPADARVRLFTAHCADGRCLAVGGEGSGVVLRGRGDAWATWESAAQDNPGLNGVWAYSATQAYAVGADGYVVHLDSDGPLRARTALTSATLHGVGGFGDVVLAVGGELSDGSPSQRGVILLLDEQAGDVTLDGVSYRSGSLQRSRSGAGQ